MSTPEESNPEGRVELMVGETTSPSQTRYTFRPTGTVTLDDVVELLGHMDLNVIETFHATLSPSLQRHFKPA